MTKTCAYCGKPFEVDDFNQNEKRRKYCSDFCRTQAINEMARERIRVGKRSYNVECEICGKVFLTNRSTNKTCSPECYYQRQKKLKREEYYRRKEEKAALPKQQKKQKKVESLTEVQRKAREAGMTYGKYMEQQYLQQLQEERERNGK